ncbi:MULTISPECIES: D-arabinono-1,4-lactone oxidase [unclassified Streptomyces]|uniref:D-arabinono-1,4-lactone oxidase n=1 Tax=unclassified Streptomyces TaxID=2593676 RepID=UPI0016614565|nr:MULTISPECIES: D-arabinono-1,4-lactone oxidase [unclassified Streptomyces]MBD0711515.1 FAD-linked oxidoreductase [Streptomyces sp. CBMA291]MBD0716519.1 FAD-linked oxidoreductase [Streptomyces sp. CBMA370]
MTEVWSNWSGSERVRPSLVRAPASTDEVAAAVSEAAARGLRVKAIGSGHSFSGAAVAPGVQLRMDGMGGLLSVDPAEKLVTVEAGMPLWRLSPLLASHGLAMKIMGDIDRQTVSGAISTGTHGSGLRFGGISTQIRALRMVLADGSVVTCSAEERPELFEAARVGIGALGVITEVTLQCVDRFALHARDTTTPVREVLDRIGELTEENDHFEFFWFPHSDVTLTRRFTRLPGSTPLKPIGPAARRLDRLVGDLGFEGLCRLGTAVPALVPPIARFAARAMSAREWTDLSPRVFASPREVRFHEGEFAIPREHAVDALREIERWIASTGERVSFPLEVRFAAADDIWLSTAHGRETCYIAFHQYHRMSHHRYFRACEDILGSYGGRPHWGKMHTLGAGSLRSRYPRFDDFTALRDTLDPTGVFANSYLDRVLGLAPGAVPVTRDLVRTTA